MNLLRVIGLKWAGVASSAIKKIAALEGEEIDWRNTLHYPPDTPLPLFAQTLLAYRAMQIDVVPEAVCVRNIGVGEKGSREIVVTDRLACGALLDALVAYANRCAPNSAEAPTITVSDAIEIEGALCPVRLTVARGAVSPRTYAAIRANYAIPPDDMFRDIDIAPLVNAIINGSPRILVTGPSGAGKTTVVQALLHKVASITSTFAVTAFGRFWEPTVFPEKTDVWGIHGKVQMPALPLSVFMSQAKFAPGLQALQSAIAQGPTRVEPDMILLDEVLTPEDLTLLAMASTTGVGFLATLHAHKGEWQGRMRALGATEMATIDAIIEVHQRQVREWYWV